MKFVMIISALSLLSCIGILHVYWAFGGRWGSAASIPSRAGSDKPVFVPGKVGTLIVAVLLFGVCSVLLIQSGYVPYCKPMVWTRWGCMACAIVFFLRAIGDFNYVGFFKKITHSNFARNDTWLYSPLCFFFGLAYGIVCF
ncbi:DUF3995 domain-containing protein [Paenibacillus sp. 32352]|uniref:DUF3995 domain-containing protein n=1 Tax=Paenibacillus sp. 32352 TaxID=1969111 RepID=UPI0009AC6B4E|nr:DUF3995 domain-containing protein [Paenibacillus sp. 32352]